MTDDLFDLNGKIALVTGASRGIGESIAKTLARRGAHVIISSRKLEGCQAVADAIVDQGGSAEAFPCHIGEMDQIQGIFDHIRKRHERLDILINNAATNPYFGHVLETDLGSFQKIVDVNIRGYFFMSVEAAKLMRNQQSGGSIVNVASIAGMTPGPMMGVYSISKAAVISMTKTFAAECAELGVRVNALLPGITDTKFASALVKNETVSAHSLTRIPMKRFAEPNEMAGTVVYLVSDAASYTTGACINVDGGYLSS